MKSIPDSEEKTLLRDKFKERRQALREEAEVSETTQQQFIDEDGVVHEQEAIKRKCLRFDEHMFINDYKALVTRKS